jgi:MFS family permease
VQLGFVAGALVSAVFNLADTIRPRHLILTGSLVAAAANTGLLLASGPASAITLRFITGAALAGVYPPALKALSTWFRAGRGTALGVMVGALTLGSALPHLVNGFGGVEWRTVIVTTSVLTLTGGLLAELAFRDGPFTFPTAVFSPREIGRLARDRGVRLASIGYFGHMWELYAMWAWIAAFYGDSFTSARAASFAAFGAIGAGAFGSVYAGLVSDRRSRSSAAALAMRWSAAASIVTGFLVDAPWPIVVGAGLVWGFWVVADSAQFSTIVTEVTDSRYVGTALTVQLAAGFVLTVFTIFFVPVIRDSHGWGWAFVFLAPGPLLGIWAMRALERTTDQPSPPATPIG